MFRLRQAAPRDAAAIHALIVELAIYEREPDAVEVTVDELREQLSSERPPFECIVAERAGEADDGAAEIVGMALFFESYSTWRGRAGIYLEDLYVRESERGRGIGRALLSRLAAIAVERDCARLEWAVLDWNTPSIEFYKALGAVSLDEWTTFRLDRDALAALATSGR